MEYRAIGSTGVRVSAQGFGGATLGNVYGAIGEMEARRAVHAALDAGISLFDVSPYYGDRLAEAVLGRALAGRRAEAVIGTKAGRNGVAAFDFGAAAIRRSLDGSLRRLGTDYVDILFAHDIEFGLPTQVLGETYEVLADLKREGKCRAIGMSALPLPVLRRAVTTCRLDVVLSYCHGALTDDSLLRDLLPVAQERGTAVINASPLCMGLLSDAGPQPWHPAPEALKLACQKAAEACAALGQSLAHASLSWAFQLDGVVST
ncbi:MAG: aldo/keto reductase, partial [Chloroflexota bacterium]